jgi:hypothetical protein
MTFAERVAAAVLLFSLPRPLLASCDCPDPFDLELQGRTIWRGERPLTLAEIAQVAAPILWYSSEEPLLFSGSGALPDPHPCDPEPASGGVVYYQARIIRLESGDDPVAEPLESDPQFFEKVTSVLLRYFFYYREDSGLGGHRHDIEVAEFHLFPEKFSNRCYQLRLSRVVGLAHGVDWYNNILDVKGDTRIPVRLLIEEAKHATCPDRNGDGVYTPGYDVNEHVNDAWGVRDVLASGTLLGSTYKASMFKPRAPRFRVGPPADSTRCPSLPASVDEEPIARHYVLRPGSSLEMCDVEHGDHLARMMKKNGIGRDHPTNQYEANSLAARTEPFKKHTSILPGISYRYDGSTYSGFSVLLRGMDRGEFWVVPKFNLQSKSLSAELLLTPSASRWADWYLALGPEYFRQVEAEEDGEVVVVRRDEWQGAIELGGKFRFRTVGVLRYIFLGYGFGGVRIGLRANGLDTIENSRLVFEFGAGIW